MLNSQECQLFSLSSDKNSKIKLKNGEKLNFSKILYQCLQNKVLCSKKSNVQPAKRIQDKSVFINNVRSNELDHASLFKKFKLSPKLTTPSQKILEKTVSNQREMSDSQITFAGGSSKDRQQQLQAFEQQMGKKLLSLYRQGVNTLKTLEQKQTNLSESEQDGGNRKLVCINRLIDILEMNKEIRLRQMFEQRQQVSLKQEKIKKTFQHKLEEIQLAKKRVGSK